MEQKERHFHFAAPVTYIEHQEITVQTGGTLNFGAPAEEPNVTEPARHCGLREAIEEVLPVLTQKRLWFPIVKVMMDNGLVPNGDFAGAKAMIERAFPEGLAPGIDAADLSRLNVQSFSRPVRGWDAANAPVQGNVYEKYHSLALRFSEIFR